MFEDRTEAGKKLAEALVQYKNENPIILAIPRRGVEVGHQIAKHLQASLSIVIVQKLTISDDSELTFGAIAEDGSCFFDRRVSDYLPPDTIEDIITKQSQEVERRVQTFRSGQPTINLFDRHVILVDEGIAVGSAMKVAIKFCRKKHPKKIIAAAPIASPSAVEGLSEIVDDVVVLKTRSYRVISEAYRNWYDVEDEVVLTLLQNYQTFS